MKSNSPVSKQFSITSAIRTAVVLLVMLLCAQAKAAVLSGYLRDASGNPIANADLDLHNAVTGAKLVTPNDNTDVTGFYSFNVFAGVYHITYDSPIGSHFVGKRAYNVTLPSTGLMRDETLDLGSVISGRIVNALAQPVDSINIDVDSLAGGRLYTSNDMTDAAGNYWIVVPNGSYRVRFSPLRGSRSRGAQLDTVVITKDTVINLTLADGFLLSGTITNSTGQGISPASIDLRDQVTGAKQFIANDKTSADGTYSVASASGMYQLRFTPPAVSRYIAKQYDSVVISADRIWNDTLLDGILVTVIAQDSAGTPIPGVNIDFKLSATSAKLYTPLDITDSLGKVVAALSPAYYTIQLDPPLAYSPVKLDSVNIQSDTIITVILPAEPRVMLSGTLSVTGLTPFGVKLELRSTLTGLKAVLNGNLADSAGLFSFAAPKDTYDLLITPPVGSKIVGKQLSALVISKDTLLDTISLLTGYLIEAHVETINGDAVANVDLDFFGANDTVAMYTPHSVTDDSGRAVVALPAGEITVHIIPPSGSPFPTTRRSITVSSDSELTFLLLVAPDPSAMRYTINQNYPNPFNGNTTISYVVLNRAWLTATIHNILGEVVAVVADGIHEPQVYDRIWDGRGRNGNFVASGVYFLRLSGPDGDVSKKMMMLK